MFAMERLQLCLWRLETIQWIHWCDLGPAGDIFLKLVFLFILILPTGRYFLSCFFLFFMVLPAGKFENPLTCPNIDIGALELTWRGCAISTKDKNIVQRYGIIHLWNYHPCWRDIFGACNGQSLGNQASHSCKCNPSCSMLNGIWSNLQLWIVSCIPICSRPERW